jgi:alkanesulfonate monooxygenase SsuD/methylene tetrahydromethanopterin reductase-like flavin-dependent oxidoreductase (luciferase family)
MRNCLGDAITQEDIRRKYEALRRHCDAFGRPYESILRTWLDIPIVLGRTRSAVQAKLDAVPVGVRTHFQSSTLAATPEEAVSHFRELAGAGVQYFVLALYGHDVETVRLLGQEVLPRVHSDSADKSGKRWFFGGRRASA